MKYINKANIPFIANKKISPLVTQLRERLQSVIIPEEDVCIDESLVPFRGRLAFKQYIKNKRHKGSSVAAWLSETMLRGRSPGASGFESHRRGRIFSKEGNSAGPWMCVYV
jgi:hypothetical protein